MLWDTHLHTHFSGDSQAEPEEMVLSAISKGIKGICITDHLDLDYPKEPELFLQDIPTAHKAISTLQAKYKDTFPVLWGIELGLQPQINTKNSEIAHSYPFDFVIGSSHVVHGFDPYYSNYYEGKTEDNAYLEYFEGILENLNDYKDFDVYGHIDYVVRYGPNKNQFYSYEKFAEVIDEILRRLISMGKGIEINTGGFKAGLGHPNPTEAILKRYHALGGEIITIGADAHTPEYVGYAFDRVPAILREAGFTHFTVFKNRKPIFYPLP